MFKISPATLPEEKEKIANELGITLRDGAFMYAMRDVDTGAVMGAAQFEIADGYGVIYDLRAPIDSDDFEAMFILGRQTMNFMDSCGVSEQRAMIGASDERLLVSIGFRKGEEYYTASTVGMFDGSHCSGHNNT